MRLAKILNSLLMGEVLEATTEVVTELQAHFEALNLGTITTKPSQSDGKVVIVHTPSDIELGVLPSHLDFDDEFDITVIN